MKYRARFSEGGVERTREVEIISSEARRVEVKLDGEHGIYDVVPLAPGACSIVAPGGRHADATVHREPDGSVIVHVGSSAFAFEFLDDLAARAREAAGRQAGSRTGDLKAAIPGRVLRLLVGAGDTVTAGQSVLVLEAMKMENDVRAPRDGVVRSVDVAAGQAVGTGDVLIRFEAES